MIDIITMMAQVAVLSTCARVGWYMPEWVDAFVQSFIAGYRKGRDK